MKKKELFVCNTLNQLFTASIIRIKMLKDSAVDIIISDIVPNYDKIAARMCEYKYFENIYTVEIKSKNEHLINSKGFEKLKMLISSSTYSLNSSIDVNCYKRIWFYNPNLLMYSILKECRHIDEVEFNHFEEGLGSYVDMIKDPGYAVKFKKLCPKFELVMPKVKKQYLFKPEYKCYDENYELVEIPVAEKSDKDIIEFLNAIFDYENNINDEKKYLIFEDCFSADNIKVNDLEAYREIVSNLGKDNFYVKRHPRNTTNRFNKLGVHELPGGRVPWELIYLNENVGEIFFTVLSSCVFTPKMQFGDKTKTVLLCNCLENLQGWENYISGVEYLANKINEKEEVFYIPKDMEELREILQKVKKVVI